MLLLKRDLYNSEESGVIRVWDEDEDYTNFTSDQVVSNELPLNRATKRGMVNNYKRFDAWYSTLARLIAITDKSTPINPSIAKQHKFSLPNHLQAGELALIDSKDPPPAQPAEELTPDQQRQWLEDRGLLPDPDISPPTLTRRFHALSTVKFGEEVPTELKNSFLKKLLPIAH